MNLIDTAIERGRLLEIIRILDIINKHNKKYEHCKDSYEDQELIENIKKEFTLE